MMILKVSQCHGSNTLSNQLEICPYPGTRVTLLLLWSCLANGILVTIIQPARALWHKNTNTNEV